MPPVAVLGENPRSQPHCYGICGSKGERFFFFFKSGGKKQLSLKSLLSVALGSQ